MARLTALGAALIAVIGAVVWMGAGGAGPHPYRVDAIFDSADFLVPGQDVKIAGAVAGSVKAVHLTPDRRARLELEVQREFGPFHSDASCSIRPESLIGEKFVDCDPGTPSGQPLVGRGGRAPAVPLARNHSPVDLDLVFAALRLPYRERFTVLLNELGVGLAGRPADLNAAIRRANPAIQRANQVLAILDRDRATLGRLIDSSDTVLARLAARRGDVASFIARADRVAGAVASRRGDLSLAIHRLPPMLAQLEPAANDLAALATDARPVAADLRVAARPVASLLGDLGPLTGAARPTLVKLGQLARTGRRTIDATMPVAQKLLPIARQLPEVATLARDLNLSLKASGQPEGLLTFLYLGTAATARFDRFTHILPSYQISGSCQQYATTPVDGCSAQWGSSGRQKASRHEGKKAGRKARRRAGGKTGSLRPSAGPGQRGAGPVAAPTSPALPSVPPVRLPPSTVPNILDYLLSP